MQPQRKAKANRTKGSDAWRLSSNYAQYQRWSLAATHSYDDLLQDFQDNREATQKDRQEHVNLFREQFGPYDSIYAKTNHDRYIHDDDLGLSSVQYSNDGSEIVAGFGSGSIHIYNSRTLNIHGVVFQGSEVGYPVTCIKFHPMYGTTFYVSTSNGIVMMLSTDSSIYQEVINQPYNPVNSVDVSSSCKNLVTVGKDSAIRIFDCQDYNETRVFSKAVSGKEVSEDSPLAAYHTNRLLVVKFDPEDPNVFVTGGWDRKVKVWDLRESNGCVATIFGPLIFGQSLDLKCKKVLTASWTAERNIQQWDLRGNLTKNCLPENLVELIEGDFAILLQYYNGDSTGDVFTFSTMGHRSLELVSINQNLVLHTFGCGTAVTACCSHGKKIGYGGLMMLHAGEIYLQGSNLLTRQAFSGDSSMYGSVTSNVSLSESTIDSVGSHKIQLTKEKSIRSNRSSNTNVT